MKSSERKHLRMQAFKKNPKGIWSKDKLHFILPAMKTNENRIFFKPKQNHISGLM